MKEEFDIAKIRKELCEKEKEIDKLMSRIREQDKSLISILETADIDYCEYDYNTDICIIEDKTRARYGVDKVITGFTEVVKKTDVIFREDKEKFLQMLFEAREGTFCAQCEARLKKLNENNFVWIKYRTYTIYENQKPARAIGIGIRIQEYKEKLEKFNRAMEQCGIYAWTVDITTKRAVWLNESNDNDHLIIDERFVDNIEEKVREKGNIYPEDREKVDEFFGRIWSGEDNLKIQTRQWSERYHSYTWFEYAASIIGFENGQPKTSLCTVRDISAEKAMEEVYEVELKNRNSLDASLVSFCRLNVTKAKMEDMVVYDEQNSSECKISDRPSMDFKKRLLKVMTDISMSDKEFEMFTVDSLRKEFANGKKEIVCSYWAKLKKNNKNVYIKTDCKILERRETGDIIAFFYNRDITKDFLNRKMLAKLSSNVYERTAAIFTKDNKLVPIDEHNANYNHIWKTADYESGLREYCNSYIQEDSRKAIYNSLKLDSIIKELEKKETYQVQYDIVQSDGSLRRKQTEISYIDKENCVLLMTRQDIALYEEFRFLSEHDSLTGLFNRSKLFKETKDMIADNSDKKFAFVQVDIDRFKMYNSTFGNEEGDKLLIFTAQLLKKAFKNLDLCIYGRLQSDVFGFCTIYDEKELKELLQLANSSLRNYRNDYVLRFSLGICIIDNNNVTLEEASARAAFAAKKSKVNITKNYALYDEDEEKQQRLEQKIINTMQLALDEKQFVVYLQPKYNLGNERPSGAEALVRWKESNGNIISPGVFIPVFEKNGFIKKMDQYMWEEVCILLRKWIDKGYKPRPISVNISRISLYDPNLVQNIVDIVEKYKIPHELFNLEITESAYVSDQVMMKKTIEKLHEEGFIILMDDFGSGYSSLNTLKDFYIDVLKVDMTFLPRNNEKRRAEIILSSIVRMAKWMDIDVIMEGVETENEKNFIKGIGCDFVQGFYYARPMPASDYEAKYLTDNKENQNDGLPTYVRTRHIDENSVALIGQECIEFATIRKTMNQFTGPASIFVYDGGAAYLKFANKAFCELLNTNEYTLTDMSYEDFILNLIHPDDACLVRDMLINLEKNGECEGVHRIRNISTDEYMWIQVKAQMKNQLEKNNAYFTFSDVTEQQKKIERESRMSECQKILTQTKVLQNGIDEVAGVIQRHYEADRVYIFEMDWKKGTMSNTHEFVKQGVTEEKNNLQNLPFSVINYWLDSFYKGEPVFIDDLESIKDDPSRSLEYDTLKPQDIKSLMTVPIIYGKQLYGYMGVDNPTDFKDDKDFLIGLAYFIAVEMNEDKLKEELLKMSYTDSLTGLNNRNSYNALIDTCLEKGLNKVGAIFADVNGLKHVNDNYGHVRGDELLQYAAGIVIDYFDFECVFRISGDEFVIVICDISRTEFERRVHKIKSDDRIAKKGIMALGEVWKEHTDDLQAVVNEAEKKMYEVKKEYYRLNPVNGR